MQVYVLEESTGKIVDYQSLNEFKRLRLQPSRTMTRPHGCFNQNGCFGTIDVKPFGVSVKGLDSDSEYRYEYNVQQWSKLVGFMQYKCMKKPEDPKQLVDKLCKIFERSLRRADMKGTKDLNFKA